MRSKMQAIGLRVQGAICGALIICLASACAGPGRPLVKWWFHDGKEEHAFIRRECDGDVRPCPIKEHLSYAEADGYYGISPDDWQAWMDYVKALERASGR